MLVLRRRHPDGDDLSRPRRTNRPATRWHTTIVKCHSGRGEGVGMTPTHILAKRNRLATIGLVTGLMLSGSNLVNTQTLFPGQISPPQPPHRAPLTPIKIVTYNIASGNDKELAGVPMPFTELCRDIMSQNPDVVVLQEVHDNWPGSRSPGI